MKTKIIVILFAITSLSAYSQTIEEDIRTMMEISNSIGQAEIIMEYMIGQYKTMLPDVPADYWELFLEEIDYEYFIELLTPIYKKYYTQEEIQDIIAFYESPTGQKMIEVQPMISQDSMIAGEEWGMILVEQINSKLNDDGYINI